MQRTNYDDFKLLYVATSSTVHYKKKLSLPFGESRSASRIISVKKETDVSLPRGIMGVHLTPIVPRGALTTILFFTTFFFLSRDGIRWTGGKLMV